MISLRHLTRSAPRAFTRLARQPAVRPSTLLKGASVTVAARTRQPLAAAAFSSSSASRKAASVGETDDELSAKLESEIQIEEDMKAEEQESASVKDFLENSPFELIDTPGQEVVKLVRSFGEERITVSFSIADISNYDPYQEDPALQDEDMEDPAVQNVKSQSAVDQDMDSDLDEAADEESAAPINLSIVIEKASKAPGALAIDATAQDGTIVVENLSYYQDATLAKAETPENAQARANVYPGPPFGSLDEDLQVMMERFLEERGITQAMAVFVPDYVDVKEQREYLRWLNNVKAFVDA